ncbi:methyltransferase [Streptomyces sp. NPDC046915]|uniref:methyltransferase n=1 Tax=Streptomyces sp. NPDC046915 TaxID=3155257 RepID=UPI00340F3796
MDKAEPQETVSADVPDGPPPSLHMVQLLAGFQFSQALYAIAKLDVASQLDDGARAIDELAANCGARPELLRRLIRSLAPLGVFRQPNEDTVELTPLGATLSARRPGSLRDVALYWMETHYLPFSEILHTVRTGEPAARHYFGKPFFDWIVADPDMAELQNRGMAGLVGGIRDRMFDDYRLPAGEVVADIGGADGTILSRLLAAEPARRGILFDLPEILPSARKKIEETGMADRVDVVAGDFFESVPSADVYVMAAILHDWDDASCVRILQSVKRAAAPGARLVVIEGVVPPGDEPHATKLIDLVMLALTTGKERGEAEWQQLLSTAGFALDRIVPTKEDYSFIEARLL